MSETVVPDTKDWTWVLDRPCPECGFDAASVTVDRIPARDPRQRDHVGGGADARRRGDPPGARHLVAAGVRLPRPRRAPHLRPAGRPDARRGRPDVRELGPGRDRDRRAVRRAGPGRGRGRAAGRGRDGRRALRVGARRGRGAGGASAATAASSRSRASGSTTCTTSSTTPGTSGPLPPGRPSRPTTPPRRPTATARRSCPRSSTPPSRPSWPPSAPGARVLEIGSAAGRDARALEAAGLSVRRTDVTPGFVELMRADGYAADVRRPAHRRPRRPAAPGHALRRRLGQRLPAARRPVPTCRWCCGGSRTPRRRAGCSAARSRRATARAGRRTVAWRRGGGSPTGGRSRCARSSTPPAGRSRTSATTTARSPASRGWRSGRVVAHDAGMRQRA